MESILQNIQASCILCRPKYALQFITRFISEEKISFHFPTSSLNPSPPVISQIIEEYHSVHILPFLITQFEEFRNTACVIFCAEQMHGHFSKDHHQFVITGGGNHDTNTAINTAASKGALASVSTDSQKDGGISGTGSASYREYLDGNTLLDILQAMDLPAYGLQNNFIDDLVAEKLEQLKKVDFPLFISAIRLPLVAYQALIWAKDEVYQYLKSSETGSSSPLLIPLKEDLAIDIGKLKTFLSNRRQTTSSNRLVIGSMSFSASLPANFQTMRAETHNYHLFPLFPDDVKHWVKILSSVVEEERNTQAVTLQHLMDKFLRKLFTATNF